MIIKKHGLILIALFLIGALLISSCKISLSQAPLTTPTLIPTGLFVSPFPSVENPMEMIEQFARASQTAAVLSGTPGTPVTASTVTTPQTGTFYPIITTPGTPTNVIPITPLPYTLTPGGPTWTPLPPIVKPSTYTLQKGEFPYCIARRFNVNPQELLSINGLAQGDLYPPSMVLTIPQSGGPFPGDRALHTHPTTYTVPSSDATIYSVACYFGDVNPAAIANANGISVSADLTTGQQLQIP